MKTLRIFISSPSDVRPERVRAYDVITRLQTRYRAFLKLEPILWEDEAMRANASFQNQIVPPSSTDIVICILWSKIGMRLPQDYKRPDGTVPTGTEWEFEDAYKSYQAKGTPDLFVYRKTSPPTVTVTSDDVLQEWMQQKKGLDAFIEHWFRDHEGAFKAAFNTFKSDEEFERMLELHLKNVIDAKLELWGQTPGEEEADDGPWFGGSPYLGLNAFQPEHAKIFFGRAVAISEITQRLLAQAATGRVFLMILGMSGCGKSSLARAGLLPELSRPAVIDRVGCWRWAILRPAEVRGSLVEGLAAVLLGEKPALPELAALGFDVPKLAQLLRDAPTHALPLLDVALGSAAKQSAKEHLSAEVKPARFVLLVDQLEEIFTLERFDAAQRAVFIAALSALSRGGLVWIITTMRSDLYYRCAEVTELVALKGEDGQYDLSPPTLSELGQMIRSPARAARLKFERHPTTHQKLDDALHEEAGKNPEVLPLLEFCLDELYKQLKTPARLITWSAYQELGGLKGAITKRAEEVYTSLSPAARNALPAVLGALIAMGKTATARPAISKNLASHPGAEEVVAAYVQASLFVTDTNQTGEAIVTLAHEALISGWARVQTWLRENEDFLRVKARIAQAAQRWREAGRDRDYLLAEGKPLAEAEDALKKRRGELDPEEIEFVEISSRTAARQRRLRRYKAAAILTVGLSLIFGTALFQARQAAAAARLATSQSDTSVAAKELQKNNVRAALAYLADALRNDPHNEQAIALAVSVLRNCPLPIFNFQHKGEVHDVAFSPDGNRLATASADGTAQLWDTKTGEALTRQKDGKTIKIILRHGNWVHAVNFNGDGSKLATSSWDHTASLWDGLTGERIGTPMKHDDRVTFACFSPDKESKLLVTTCWNGEVRLWNAQTGQPMLDSKGQPLVMAHKKTVWNADFSPDGTRLVTASVDGSARVWEVSTGKPALAPNGTELVLQHNNEPEKTDGEAKGKKRPDFNFAKFSPDGRLIADASDDGQVWLWDAQTGETLTRQKDGKTIKIILQHGNQVNRFGFSPDSRRIVTASLDKTAHVWDVRTGQPIGAEMRHEGWVNTAVFSPDGRLVLTSSADGTVRVWDAESGEAIGHPMYHGSAVYLARFSPDGRRIAGASFDGTARLWSVQSGEPNKPMRHGARIVAATISPDGEMILTASEDGKASLWKAPDNKSAGTPFAKSLTLNREGAPKESKDATEKSKVINMSFSPDGKTVATASTDGMACLWDISSGQPGKPRVFAHPLAVRSVKFSRDGKYIVTGSDDGLARVWDVSTGDQVGKPMRHEGIVRSACFSPDGKLILTASMDHWARMWDAATHKPEGEPMRHENWVYDAEFSSDGRWIVTASGDKTARLWAAPTGKPVGEPMGHDDAVIAAGFSPDGRWIVTASWDETARTWDARTGKPVGVSFRHGSKLTSASFNPDPKKHWILTSTESGIARLWGFPITTPHAPDWLKDLVEDVGGLRLDNDRNLAPTPKTADLKKKYQDLPETDELSRFVRWLISAPAERNISPLSGISVASFVDQMLALKDEESLKQAYRADPGNPLVLARLAKSVAATDPDTAK